MVGFGLDYACAHIIIPASVNLLPIQADFVTERDNTRFAQGGRDGRKGQGTRLTYSSTDPGFNQFVVKST